jgi:hypothetical protein
MSTAEIQEKISAARREADGLKDKIRSAKDQTADTSCALTLHLVYSYHIHKTYDQYEQWQTTLPLYHACR